MGWRNHPDHKSETKAVKAALREAGIDARVGHGSGTAWGWLEINVGSGTQFGPCECEQDGPRCRRCREMRCLRDAALQIAQRVTGRSGEHSGDILVLSQEDGGKPIVHPRWLKFGEEARA